MSKKTGEFCRVKIAGVDTECMIKDTDSEKNLIALRRIGNGQTLKVSPGEILPSMGKAARTKQEQESFKAGEIVFAKKNGAEEWAKVKIFETLDDGSGKKYAVVTFVDTGIEDSVWLDEVKPVKMWIVGDLCKALWSEDGVIYEVRSFLKPALSCYHFYFHRESLKLLMNLMGGNMPSSAFMGTATATLLG